MHALSSMENSLFQAMVDRKLGGKGNGKLCVERELKRRRRRRRRSRSKSREKRELQVSVRPLTPEETTPRNNLSHYNFLWVYFCFY
jgi:hypothetical protein